MAVPTDAHRKFASDARAFYIALTDVGFTADEAVTVLCQVISDQPPKRSARLTEQERKALIDRVLARQDKTATEGAPAHE